ncbi:MAG: HNH endonuclease [Selenomonadaceae bacterium]|nr:HNH endonuclease [Selenomonadaceae bacterium]
MTKKEREREYWRQRYEKEFKPAYDAFIPHYPLTIENLPGEIWLPVPDYENYHGSNFGRVKSFWRGNEKIKIPSLHTHGYLRVALYKNGKMKNFLVHILIAKLFIPNPENLPEVNHEDGCKFNCHVSNLYWSTSAENLKHAVRMGLVKSGKDNYRAKLTNEQVLYIRENPDSFTLEQLAAMFELSQTAISKIQLGKRYKNAGGTIRGKKFTPTIITDEMRAQIIADYQKGVPGHGCIAVGKRFGVSPQTVWNIVNEQSAE